MSTPLTIRAEFRARPRLSPARPPSRRPRAAAFEPLPIAGRVAVALKTALDYPAAVLLAVVTAPLLLVAVVATRLSSRGPVFYCQTRVGLRGRHFTIYKVRTMAHECESLTGPRWSMPGDPRVTPVGNVLRKLHLDELPQLWNVLKGDMALVGPRPERPEIVAKLADALPGYHARHRVKPGITGFAQVHLPPDVSLQSVRDKVAFDRLSIRRVGLAFDLGVLLLTGAKVLGLKGLYARKPRRHRAVR